MIDPVVSLSPAEEPVPDMPKANGKTPAGDISQSMLITREESLMVSCHGESHKDIGPKIQLSRELVTTHLCPACHVLMA